MNEHADKDNKFVLRADQAFNVESNALSKLGRFLDDPVSMMAIRHCLFFLFFSLLLKLKAKTFFEEDK